MILPHDILRADTFFYIAQHYNLMKQHDQAYREIIGAMELEVPKRSLFLWLDVYRCLRWVSARVIAVRGECRGGRGVKVGMRRARQIMWSALRLAERLHVRRHRELARAVSGASDEEVVDWKRVKKLLARHMCTGHEASEIDAAIQLAKKKR